MIRLLDKNKFRIVLFFIVICSLAYYLNPLTKPNNIIGSLPGDTYYYAYETKWFCSNYFKNDLINNDLFAPIGVDMSPGYHMPFLLTVGCVLYSRGPVAMFNFIEIIQVLLILFSSILVAFRFIKNNYIRIFFIFIYSFTTFYLARIYGHTDVLSTIWGASLCFYFFYDINLNSLKKVITAFLFLVIAFVSCWQNIPNLFFLVVVFMLISIWKYRKNNLVIGKNILIALFISVPIFLIFTYPMLSSFLKNKKNNKDLINTYIYVYNADALSYLVPLKSGLFKKFTDILYKRISASRPGGYFELYNSIDFLVVIIFVFSIFNYKKGGLNKNLILFLIFTYYLLSLGPRLTVAGETVIQLPYYKILAKYPPYSLTRTPARLGIVTTFLVTIFSLTNLDLIVRKNKNLIIKIALIVFCFYGILNTTYYSQNLKFLSFDFSKVFPWFGLNTIKQDEIESYVLNIPLATKGDDASQNFMQLYHQKKIITGLVSYAAQTDDLFNYIADDPVLSHLGCQNDRFIFSEKDAKGDLKNILYNDYFFSKSLVDKRIKYIIVNKDILKNDYCDDVRQYFEKFIYRNPLLKLIEESDSYTIFEIENY